MPRLEFSFRVLPFDATGLITVVIANVPLCLAKKLYENESELGGILAQYRELVAKAVNVARRYITEDVFANCVVDLHTRMEIATERTEISIRDPDIACIALQLNNLARELEEKLGRLTPKPITVETSRAVAKLRAIRGNITTFMSCIKIRNGKIDENMPFVRLELEFDVELKSIVSERLKELSKEEETAMKTLFEALQQQGLNAEPSKCKVDLDNGVVKCGDVVLYVPSKLLETAKKSIEEVKKRRLSLLEDVYNELCKEIEKTLRTLLS